MRLKLQVNTFLDVIGKEIGDRGVACYNLTGGVFQ